MHTVGYYIRTNTCTIIKKQSMHRAYILCTKWESYMYNSIVSYSIIKYFMMRIMRIYSRVNRSDAISAQDVDFEKDN